MVAFRGRGLSSDGALGSMVKGDDESNKLLKRSVSLVFAAIMYATGWPLSILANEFPLVRSLK